MPENTRLPFSRPITDYGKVQRFISSCIRNRRVFWRPLKTPLYLNIGCGPKITPALYNIDYSWVPGIDRCLDLETVSLEFPGGSVAGAVSEHCFEHLSFATVVRLFEELHALLKPGCVFRLIVPDAELHARLYLSSLESGQNEVPFHDSLARSGIRTPVMSINDCMREHGHRFIYDFNTLSTIAARSGFSQVRKCSFMQGDDKNLLIDSPERRIESLYFEVTR